MKFPASARDTMPFSEQVILVTDLFDLWNDCEKTVVLYGLLKQMSFPSLKFLQLAIEYNIANNISTTPNTAATTTTTSNPLTSRSNNNNNDNNHSNSNTSSNSNINYNNNTNNSNSNNNQHSASSPLNKYHLLESNSNNGKFLSKLVTVYKSLKQPSRLQSDNVVMDHGRGGQPPANTMIYSIGSTTTYDQKEDLLRDVLVYLPLLKPGNEEAKAAYISLLPAAIADCIKQLVPVDVVQQILSYLLIHPAMNVDDRRPLQHWLQLLGQHISATHHVTDGSDGSECGGGLHTSTAAGNGCSSARPIGTIIETTTDYSGQLSQKSLFPAPPPTPPPPTAHHQSSQSQYMSRLHSMKFNSQNKYLDTAALSKLHPQLMWDLADSNSDLQPPKASGGTITAPQDNELCNDRIIKEFRKTIGNPRLKTATVAVAAPATTSTSSSIISSISSSGSTSSASSSSSSIAAVTNNNNNNNTTNNNNVPLPLLFDAVAVAKIGRHPITATTTNAVAVAAAPEEDHSISFSKNGTEIIDFDCDDNNKCNTQIVFESAPPPSALPHPLKNDYLAVPHVMGNCFFGSAGEGGGGATTIDNCQRMLSLVLKTRRSNSLTTASTVSMGSKNGSGGGGGVGGCGGSGGACNSNGNAYGDPGVVSSSGALDTINSLNQSSSTENLVLQQQMKPRSFSLSIEGQRGSLLSHGSETRLDDLKPNGYQKVAAAAAAAASTNNPGMNCIGQWLKSLRLHKYVWLFFNLSYEQMLAITEEYLANLNVTKGARTKLVLCIQKLKERYGTLQRLEDQLLSTPDIPLGPIMDELMGMVQTPMKPMDQFNEEDIASKFLKVSGIVANVLLSRSQQGVGPAEEECVSQFLWMLDRSLHNEALHEQMEVLKELKFKMSKIRMLYVNKPHFGKNIATAPGKGGRWTAASTLKKQQQGFSQGMLQSGASTGGCDTGNNRRNSGPMIGFGYPPHHQGGTVGGSASKLIEDDRKGAYMNGKPGSGPQQQQHNPHYNKSSSYPNFAHHFKLQTNHNNAPPHLQQQQHQQGKPNTNYGKSIQQLMQHQPQPLIQHQQQLTRHQPPQPNNNSGPANYHRHSLNSLMMGNGDIMVAMNVLRQQQGGVSGLSALCDVVKTGRTARDSSEGSRTDDKHGGGGAGGPQRASSSSGTSTSPESNDNENIDIGNQCADKSIGDINSRLEFLCLQMTEQAIN